MFLCFLEEEEEESEAYFRLVSKPYKERWRRFTEVRTERKSTNKLKVIRWDLLCRQVAAGLVVLSWCAVTWGIVSWPVQVELKGPGVVFNLIYIRPPSKADDWKEKRGNWRHHRGYYSPVKISLSLEFVWLKFLSSLFFLECSRATPAGKYGQHISLLVQEEGLVTLCIISFLCQRSTSSVSIPPQDDSRVSGGNECRRNKRGKRNERQMVEDDYFPYSSSGSRENHPSVEAAFSLASWRELLHVKNIYLHSFSYLKWFFTA